ncbi:hypothetical protein [Chryseobacterium sp. Mn2064]|uniref:hypothetical protein n=1 Tax=Chryseobacterium sp. Mn2064 TaxID=3395263 RepID=UPI003BD291BB
MKTFVKYDFYIQLFFLMVWPLTLLLVGGPAIIWFYFMVGFPQLISFLIKLFLRLKKTLPFYIYGAFIIPAWISLVLIVVFNIEGACREIPEMILMMAILYSPPLAILYICENYDLYQSLHHYSENNQE